MIEIGKACVTLSEIGGDVYLFFRCTPAALVNVESVFPLTESLQAYAGPAKNALLDRGGHALGIIIQITDFARAVGADRQRAHRPLDPSDFQLQASDDVAYLLFPGARRGKPVHETIILSDGAYFRKGTRNPDVILDLEKDGFPRGVEILNWDE